MNHSAGVRAVQSGRPLPWEADSRLKPARRKCVWQHTVYCGIFSIEAVRDHLAEVFQDTGGENYDGRIGGHGALLAFTVNAEGKLIKDSVTVSACGWAVGRSASPGPGVPTWLDGFPQAEADCSEVLLALGDGKVEVRGGRCEPGEQSMLRVAGKLALDAVLDGATAGLTTLARESVGRLLSGTLGAAASDGAGKATESLAQGAVGAYEERRQGADGSGADGSGVDGADEGAEAGEEGAESAVRPPPALGTKPLTVADLAGVTKWLADQLGVTAILDPDTARIKSFQVGEARADETPRQDLLNSFVADDLDRVTAALVDGQGGVVLERYLTPDDELDRAKCVDVRNEPATVLAGVGAHAVPAGSWPSSHPLALSQQFAVNQMRQELLTADGTFSVNGPPGTGKTTLLRDVVAGLVTDRAAHLARLSSPDEAFTGKSHMYSVDGRRHAVHQLASALTGYEMVVASANNGAVENITQEIPALSALPEEWHEEASYLREPALSLSEGRPVWGAVAARLGRRSHRTDFVERFWWADPSRDRNAPPNEPPAPRGLRAVLADPTQRLDRSGWQQAVARFRAAEREVERLRAERVRAANELHGLSALTREVGQAEAAAARAEAQQPDAQSALQFAQDLAGRLSSHADRCSVELNDHVARVPGLATGIFTLGRAHRDWHAQQQRLLRVADAARSESDEARRACAEKQQEVDRLGAVIEQAATARAQLAERRRRIEAVRARWGSHVPAVADYSAHADRAAEERRERSAPWSDAEFTRARARLFVEALRLHEAFLLAGGKKVQQSLGTAMQVVKGTAPAGLSAEGARAAWQWLFLTVPVVSTTFASYDRMFAGLGAGALGWLFIDEAGQAAPQMAVGALWRTRKAVVVGDPKQLEPVVVLPFTAQQRLRAHYEVAETWVPKGTSVQQLVDRTNTWGTWLPDTSSEEDELWVGAPLRVHRRCDDPMFAVSNEIAYGGMMVDGVGEQGRADFTAASRSVWWHVAGSEARGHWVPEEGRALKEAVARLLRNGLPDDELFVLSPFRAVSAEAVKLLRGTVPQDRIGTVHTAQGKESDVVILILGTARDAAASRNWASQSANLLNVAVSRAKRRLIVIGDHDAWKRHRFFSTLARELPQYRTG
ncbi:DEAD/DEAH box helicase [Streptomyces tardus]|nr:DEAD/DEAH box helicase [Streptomyces tardus]